MVALQFLFKNWGLLFAYLRKALNKQEIVKIPRFGCSFLSDDDRVVGVGDVDRRLVSPVVQLLNLEIRIFCKSSK